MGTAVAPETTAGASQYSLSNPPAGASFEYDEVKGDRGQKSFGQVPLLTWDESEAGIQGAIAYYGPQGIARFVNGTSLRVSCQAIARRGKAKNLTDEQIALEQLNFRPGQRQSGQSTPASRAVNATRKATQKISGDSIAEFWAKMEDPAFRASVEALGIKFEAPPAAEEEDEEEEGVTQ